MGALTKNFDLRPWLLGALRSLQFQILMLNVFIAREQSRISVAFCSTYFYELAGISKSAKRVEKMRENKDERVHHGYNDRHNSLGEFARFITLIGPQFSHPRAKYIMIMMIFMKFLKSKIRNT